MGAAAILPVQKLFAQDIGMIPKPVGEGTTTVAYGTAIHPTRKPPRNITIPDAGEFKVLKGDFHMHTLFSDGSVLPQDRVREAIDNGLDVISITDHINHAMFSAYPGVHDVVSITDHLGASAPRIDQNISYILAQSEAEKHNLILIRGVEIATSEWHHNCLFVQDVNAIAEANVQRTLRAEGNDWQKMLAVSVQQGGFNIWNHPNWIDRNPDTPPFGLKTGEPMRFFDEMEDAYSKGLLHGIEVFNGVRFYPIVLDWCHERDLAPVTVTDIHQSDWNTYGHQNPLRPMSLIFAKDRSHDSVREAFFAKRIVGWAANMILGRQPWVEKLFRSCVEIKKEGNGLTLRNLSDIPCLIEADGKVSDLVAQGSLAIAATNKLTVNNWFVGTHQPLEITVQ